MDENNEEIRQLLEQILEALTGREGRVQRELEDLGTNSGRVSAELLKIEAATKKLQKQFEENLWQATDQLGTAVGHTAKAFTDLDPKLDKFGSALSALGDAAVTLGKNFGLPGLAIGYAIKGLTKVGEAALAQTDAMLNAKDTITKLGGAGTGTAEEILKMGHAAGLNAANLEKLTRPMKSLAGSFSSLSGSFADGQKTFMQMTAVTDKQRREFGRLGFSQEELIQAQANYVKLQAESGRNIRLQFRDADKLRDASLKYTQNLVALAAITGEDLEGAQKAQEFAQNQYAEQLRDRKEQMKLADLNAQLEKAGSEKERKALQDEIKSIEAQREYRLRAGAMAAKVFGPEAASSLMNTIATGFIDSSSKMFLTAGFDPTEMARIGSGIKDVGEISEKLGGSFNKLMDAQNRQVNIYQQTAHLMDKEQQSALFLSQESLKSGKFLGTDFVQLMKNAGQKVEEQMTAGADPMADAREDLRATQIKIAVGLDKLLLAVNPLTSKFGLAAAAAATLAIAAGTAAVALGGLSRSGAIDKLLGNLKGGKDVAGVGKGMFAGIGGRVLGGGLAAAAGTGLSMAGDAVGGTTGKVMSGVGTIAQFAGTGAMVGGPWGALIGGVAGLGKVVYDNIKATNEAKDATLEKLSVDQLLTQAAEKQKDEEKKTQEGQKRLEEANKELQRIIGDNTKSFKDFNGALLKTLTQDQIDALAKNNSLTEEQIRLLKQAQQDAGPPPAPPAPEAPPEPPKTFTDTDKNKLAELESMLKEANKSAGQDQSKLSWWEKAALAMSGAQGGLGMEAAVDPATQEARELLRKEIKALREKQEADEAAAEKFRKEQKARSDEQSRQAALAERLASLRKAAGLPDSTATPSSTTAGKGGTATEEDLIAQGLKIKEGDVHGDGFPLNSRIIDLAKNIQDSIPGFRYFSAFNDEFHNQKKPGSQHTKGTAVDFTLARTPSVEEGQNIVKQLKSMGFATAIDEYNNMSRGATGGHIHAQLNPKVSAAKGGIAEGPTSGYPATLHGKEMITPLKPDSILERLAKTTAPVTTKETPVVAQTPIADNKNLIESIVQGDMKLADTLSSKLDRIAYILENSQNVHEKTLRAVRS